MARRESHFQMRGGLDLVSSPLVVEPGRLWTGLNYAPTEAGYRRIAGYERKDGRPAPSDAAYWMLGYTLGATDTEAAVGDEIAAGAASATVLAVTDDDYVLGELSGSIADAAALTVSGAAAGTANGTPRRLGADTIDLDLDYRDLAATNRRSAITAVPGIGRVRGVWFFKNELYAFRDVEPGSGDPVNAKMFKATTAGWSEVNLGHALNFDGGTDEPFEGDRMSVSGGAVATLSGYRVTSGAWSSDDAAGVLYLNIESGTFADDDTLRRGAVGSEADFATADGTATATTLPADGSYRFANHNFKGQADSAAMYGVQGRGNAFRYDGIALVFIPTGHADDRPTHIAVHRQHLLLAYPGGSLIVSETGNPLGHTAAKGAAEIAGGQDINGLAEGVGAGNTIIVGEDRIQALYGADSAEFSLADHSDRQTGGVENTLEQVGGPLYMDNRGVRSVTTTEAYGNFVIGTMTAAIQPWIDRQREERNRAVGSLRVRSNDQYRLWFESGIGICIYLGRGRPEISFIDYGSDDADNQIFPRCSVSAEDENRIERVYFGADNGFVYEAERGRSFDGREISAYARLPLNHVGQPSRQKRFHNCDLHLDVASRIQLGVSALYDDGANPEQLLSEESIYGGGGLWEEGFFDEFYYDSPLNGYHQFDLFGMGRNVSLLISSRTKKEAPHTLNGLTLHWSARRAER